jgi:hypothetical protein
MKGISKRTILDQKPLTFDRFPSFFRIKSDQEYKRGVASTLLRSLQTPHLLITLLRQSLYHAMGVTEEVKEIMPMFNGEAPVWLF